MAYAIALSIIYYLLFKNLDLEIKQKLLTGRIQNRSVNPNPDLVTNLNSKEWKSSIPMMP